MYHSHFNELQQISSGLYGAIVVVEPGRQHDQDTDRVLLFSDGGITLNPVVGPFDAPLLNGQARPQPLELRAGVTYRFRLINIRSVFSVTRAVLAGDQPVEWRHVAKDGAELPPCRPSCARRSARSRSARSTTSNSHRAPAELTLRFGHPDGFRPPPIAVPER